MKELDFNQWRNKDDVRGRFRNIPNKSECKIIQLDIKEFYPSITEKPLNNAITFAENYIPISKQDIRILKHCRKSLLFYGNEAWKKKDADTTFDVTMGSYDGAEFCQLIWIYIQSFNLENNTYRTYKNPNDQLIYIDVSSNHPPQIKWQLTKIISDRLSRNSSNADIFKNTKLEYQEALKKCGHTIKLTYTPANHEQNNVRRKRQRKIIWFKPPFNLDVSTNMAKIFFYRKKLPPFKQITEIFNKNTVKVSYSCTQNMLQIIKGHNKKIVQKEIQETLECNCRVKTDCPLYGDCRKESVIHKCIATTCNSKKVYLGLVEIEFKKQRYYDHAKSFKN